MKPLASLLILLLLGIVARADLPSPRFDRLTPLGAAAGTSVEVEVAGADIEEARTLLFDHPGIKAEHIKDRKFKVTVAADVPPGTWYEWVEFQILRKETQSLKEKLASAPR